MHVPIASEAHEKKPAPFIFFPTQIDRISQHKGDSVISPQLVSAGNSLQHQWKYWKLQIFTHVYFWVNKLWKRKFGDCFSLETLWLVSLWGRGRSCTSGMQWTCKIIYSILDIVPSGPNSDIFFYKFFVKVIFCSLLLAKKQQTFCISKSKLLHRFACVTRHKIQSLKANIIDTRRKCSTLVILSCNIVYYNLYQKINEFVTNI